MLVNYLLVALLPAIAFSYMTIVVKTGKNINEASIDHTGNSIDVITDEERKLFGLSDDNLKKATKIYKGAACKDVYVKPPTPWGDVYLQFGWKEVETVIKPIRNRIVNIKSENVTLSKQQYHNGHRKRDVRLQSRVQAEVNETVKHTWSGATSLTTSEDVRYRISFGAASIGGMTTLVYGSPFGNKTSENRRVLLGAISKSSITIGPNQTITEVLTATKGTMDIEVDYKVTLMGEVFCNYDPKYNGHHFYAFYASNLQRALNLTRSVIATEKIKITFYSLPRIKLYAAKNNSQLADFDGEIDEEP